MPSTIQEESIDLASIQYRNYSDEEKANFKKVNDGFEEQASPVLNALKENPQLLRLPDVNFEQVLDTLNEATELKVIEEWLDKKLTQINETRRAKLSEVKGVIDQMVAQAKPISQADPEVANIFADLFDFLSAPAKKAANTRKKNKE